MEVPVILEAVALLLQLAREEGMWTEVGRVRLPGWRWVREALWWHAKVQSQLNMSEAGTALRPSCEESEDKGLIEWVPGLVCGSRRPL